MSKEERSNFPPKHEVLIRVDVFLTEAIVIEIELRLMLMIASQADFAITASKITLM